MLAIHLKMKFLMYGLFYKQVCKIILAFLLFISSKNFGPFQSSFAVKHLDPYDISINGGTKILNQLLFDWTLGNMGNTISYTTRPSMIVSTGYLQNSSDVLALYQEIESFGLQIKVGPNPFQNKVWIHCAQDGLVIIAIKFFNSNGFMIKHILGPFSGLYFEQNFEIQKLITPICYVQVQYKVANEFTFQKTYKLLQHL